MSDALNPRRLSVKLFEEELAGLPDLTLDELKALLALEAKGGKVRRGVEAAIDARLIALANEALEAAAEDAREDEVVEEEEVEAEADDLDETISAILDADTVEEVE